MSASPTALAAAHLCLPFAACTDDSWQSALKALPSAQTRHFTALLQGMAPLPLDEADARSLSTPHERALARHMGLVGPAGQALPDGLIPWAAWERAIWASANKAPASPTTGLTETAWAIVTPCHWSMGREHATLTDPGALVLSETDSKTLLTAMHPYCQEDGITLHYLAPTKWLAEGEVFRRLPTAALDRVLGRDVDPWLPAGDSGKLLRRLQNEMQMLLYTHPVNEARALQRQVPVNSLWFSGTGDLSPATLENITATRAKQDGVQAPRSLAQAALAGDWEAYGAAWAELDATYGRDLLARQEAGEVVHLTLCGERAAQTYISAPPSVGLRIKRSVPFLFSPRPLWDYLGVL